MNSQGFWQRRYQLVFLLLLLSLPLLFIDFHFLHWRRSLQQLWSLGHIPLMALLSLLLLQWPPLRKPSRRLGSTVVVLVTSLLVGIAIEQLQTATGRSNSWHDILLGLLGAIVVLAWRSPPQVLPRLLSLLCLGASLLPLTNTVIDEIRAEQQFPVLADFKDSQQLQRFQFNATTEWQAGQVRLHFTQPQRYPGFSLLYFPADWRNYQSLQLTLENPGDTALTLSCRINDQRHNFAHEDRFNRQITLPPKLISQITFLLSEVAEAPAQRTMNMAHIDHLECFGNQQLLGQVINLHRIQLQ